MVKSGYHFRPGAPGKPTRVTTNRCGRNFPFKSSFLGTRGVDATAWFAATYFNLKNASRSNLAMPVGRTCRSNSLLFTPYCLWVFTLATQLAYNPQSSGLIPDWNIG